MSFKSYCTERSGRMENNPTNDFMARTCDIYDKGFEFFAPKYLLCEMSYDDGLQVERNVTRNEVMTAVQGAIKLYHGDYGAGVLQRSFQVKYINKATNIVILRVDRAFYQLLMSAIFFVSSIGSHKASFCTLHVAGTLRSCYKFLIKYHTKNLPFLINQCTSEEEKTQVVAVIQKASGYFRQNISIDSQSAKAVTPAK